MKIIELLNHGKIFLKDVDEGSFKAKILLEHILKVKREYIIAHCEDIVSNEQVTLYQAKLEEIKKGKPIQYITHYQEFMKLDFYVDENVLIPRQDTEVLVEEVIKIAKNIRAKKILDLCTGSGAIAVSLAKYLENIQITALDISRKALDVAIANAKNNHVQEKITFVESNLFQDLAQEKYDIIVSNPPYIRSEEIEKLDEEVKREPKVALDGGKDGLEFYRKIIDQGYQYLKYGGYICFEIGYDQKEEVLQIIKDKKQYTETYCKKDLYDNDRVVVTRLG